MSKPTPFHERCDSGTPPAFPAHTWVARPLHDASGNAPQATDSHPHVRGVEGDPTRLSGSGPGGPLWRGHRGRLPVHLDVYRCGNRVDGMSSLVVSEPGNGAGSLSTSTDTVPVSNSGDQY